MPKKILIIEDDPFLREMITKKLGSEKYKPILAIDGEEGLKKTKEEKPDLILLDLILPGIDGYEVLKKIKSDKKTSSIPVVILSNLGQREEIEKGKKMGATDFLVKAHFTPNDIVERIKKSIE